MQGSALPEAVLAVVAADVRRQRLAYCSKCQMVQLGAKMNRLFATYEEQLEEHKGVTGAAKAIVGAVLPGRKFVLVILQTSRQMCAAVW